MAQGITSIQKRAQPREQMFEHCEVAKALDIAQTKEKHNTITQTLTEEHGRGQGPIEGNLPKWQIWTNGTL